MVAYPADVIVTYLFRLHKSVPNSLGNARILYNNYNKFNDTDDQNDTVKILIMSLYKVLFNNDRVFTVIFC